MDSRLQLTEEQKRLVEQLEETIDKLHESGVTIISDKDADLFFYNNTQIDSWCQKVFMCEGDYEMFIDELPCVETCSIRLNDEDRSLGILFSL